jgi:glycosyltransferase involved in cell wall biosynthesis
MLSPNKRTSLQLIDSLYRGGAQKVVLEIVMALPEFNHFVGYWADDTDLEDEFIKNNVTLIKLPFDGVKTLPRTIRYTNKFINDHPISHVHSHMFAPNMIARAIKRKGLTTICTYHGECLEADGLTGYIQKTAERLSLSRTDKIIAVSDHVKKYIHSKLSTQAPIEVIHNFGETFDGHLTSQRHDHRNLKIVATSNNQPYKNYPLLIEAFSQLQEVPVTLYIFGNNMDPLINKTKMLGLKNVEFMGVVPNVSKILGDYDVYIAASDSGEGFSLSMLEAMNAGLPVICSDIPQFIEAVGDAGIIFRNRDAGHLAEQIKLLLNDCGVLKKYSSLIKFRTALFSKTTFIEKIRALYEV